eukprot:m.392758 g.392758  ORF g.392758 m.392758 type:complete len:311 (-) comp21084_c0_seq11:129-1061(-)
MAPIYSRILQAVFYGGAPFFTYPWKPILNYVIGSDYTTAYTHFRRDHKIPANLAAHTLCLCWQLCANFGLLASIDSALGTDAGRKQTPSDTTFTGSRMFSKVSAIAWMLPILTATPCPLPVKALSAAAVWGAFSIAQNFEQYWLEIAALQGVIEALAIQTYIIREPIGGARLVAVAIARQAIQYLVIKYGKGILEKKKTAVNIAVAAFVLAMVTKENVIAKESLTVFHLGFVGWIFAVLTNQPWLFFYAGGFVASVAQGVSHIAAGEMPTLVQMQQNDSSDTLGQEWAHGTFFPNLLLNSIYESITGAAH